MECEPANCGTVSTHHYINTKLTMSAANPNYQNTLALNGASGNLVTADGGKTWTVADITVNQYTYTQVLSCNPSLLHWILCLGQMGRPFEK